MFVHRLASLARKILPAPLFKPIRGISTALLTPLAFSYHSGHLLSSIKTKAVDKSGKPLPWYTYPAIEFLTSKNFRDRSVLEFGAGQSTLWWAERSNRVIAFEDDVEWYNAVTERSPANVSVVLTDRAASAVESHCLDELFDVIVIDGLNRLTCATKSVALHKKGGAIILDNSEGYWGLDGEFPILDLFRAEGFSRIDFYGYAPGVILPACTSLFFKGDCFLLCGSENTVKTVR